MTLTQTEWTDRIECRGRSSNVARSLADWQVRILAWRVARLVRDELEMLAEEAL